MNKKGQALIEFILILPIAIILILGLIDFGIITYQKNLLENKINDVIEVYDNSYLIGDVEKYLSKKDSSIKLDSVVKNNQYITFYLSKQIDPLTPGLNLIIGDPYTIKVERTTLYES